MKNLKILIILLLLIVVNLTSCVKDASKCPRVFEIPAQTIPYSEAYNIGDTITITSKFHRKVYERQTDKKYDMKDIKWKPSLILHKIDIDSIETNNKTKEYIDFISNATYDWHWFTYSDGNSYLAGQFEYGNDTFSIELKIILKKEGIYILGFGGGLFASNQDFPGKCRHADFEVATKMNGDQDNNIHLLQESPDSHYNGWILQKTEQRYDGAYSFRVLE